MPTLIDHLSPDEQTRIAKEIHEDFERIVKKVKIDMEILNQESKKRAEKFIEQQKRDQKLLYDMKPSFFGWLVRGW